MILRSLSLLLIGFVLIGCNATPKAPPVIKNADQKAPPLHQIYVGLTEAKASQKAKLNKQSFRVVERDGRPMMITMDYIQGRINAYSNNGIIRKVRVE